VIEFLNAIWFSHPEVMNMSIVVCWVLTLCSILGGYRRFVGTCHLHLHGRSAIIAVQMEAMLSPETLVTNYKTT
jgi:hypothetical protein